VGLFLGCTQARDEIDPGPGLGPDSSQDGDDGQGPGGDDGDDDGGEDDGGMKFDTPMPDDDDGAGCEHVEHVPCDDGTNDLFQAIGINCPGEMQVDALSTGYERALGVLTSFGETAEWVTREGSAMAALGTGFVDEFLQETANHPGTLCPAYCSNDVSHPTIEDCKDETMLELGEHDPGPTLPSPIDVNPVGGDCVADPGLVGTGDCSNSLAGQFNQGRIAHDYAEMRMTMTVPENVTSFSFDFAFFSTEYPIYYGRQYNDMFVAWLESGSWTGNVSFDELGNPISLNAAFLDFRDDEGTLPEFAGTCMREHAGTKWLTTTVQVTPGEEIRLVFAIFDLADPILDSYVLIDNWRWGCEAPPEPETKPVG
jgi:hypothetical protein